ncbi:MAG TPA: tetratricopeptide repeat protein [Fimbriiglobus sp.]|jgi:predicted Zn-dependent protease|nr:tetratricopeptide repeat protein [Fimbriiglobus sp.]
MSRLRPLLVLALLSVPLVFAYLRSRPPSLTPDEWLARGQQAVRGHDVREAERVASQLRAEGQPEHAALLMGEIHYRRKQFDRAEQELARIDGASPLFPEAATFFGLCRLQQYDLRLAEQLFRRVLEVRPESVEAHRGLADVYFSLGAMSRALEEMETVARLDPADARPWFFMGNFYADVGLRPEAAGAYENALSRAADPDAATQARFGLAESLLKTGDHARALAVLADLPPDKKAEPAAALLRADALARQGRLADAERELAPLLAGGSPSAAVRTVAGRVAFDSGAYDRAAALLEPAVKQDAANHEANHYLAQAYTRLGKADLAAAQQKRADQIQEDLKLMSRLHDQAGQQPWNAAIREQLAAVTRRLGRTEIAERWERAAKSCAPAPGTAP